MLSHSQVIILTKDQTAKYNAFATKMDFIKKYWENCQDSRFIGNTNLVCMENGSFYSTKSGFILIELLRNKIKLISIIS